MNIKEYLDSTYLKTAEQAGVSVDENRKIVQNCIQEAIDEKFKLIMIRPDMVGMAQEIIENQKSKVLIGTVISFPEGTNSLIDKLEEAQKAIDDGADELDFVCNYRAFKDGKTDLIKEEVYLGTKLGLSNKKAVKWIIEVAALTDAEIIKISALIKNTIISSFKEENLNSVFVKSSTGFFKTQNNLPNGATRHTIIMMLENASPLPVKAAGGVRTTDEAIEMIRLGVKRIGTSSAKAIANGEKATNGY